MKKCPHKKYYTYLGIEDEAESAYKAEICCQNCGKILPKWGDKRMRQLFKIIYQLKLLAKKP